MDLIRITHDNIEKEHICCAISSNKDCQVHVSYTHLTKDLLLFSRSKLGHPSSNCGVLCPL